MNILDIRNVINSTKFNNSNVDIIKFNGQEVWTAGYWLTKTGYPLTLTNSLGKKLKDYKIYGNSIRIIDKTGNIFDGNMQQGMYLYTNGTYLFVQNYICSANRIAIEQSTKYYINVIYSGSDTLSGKIIYYGEDGNFVSYAVIDNLGTNSFTTASNASYMALDICKTSGANITVDEIEDITISKTPISVEMKDFGDKTKNLFDINSAVRGKGLAWATGAYYNNETAIASDFIKIKKNENYVSKYYAQVILYDKNQEYISSIKGTTPVKSFEITNENCEYIKIAFKSSDNTGVVDFNNVNDIQLELGDKATSYEPYGYKIPVKISGKNLLDYNAVEDTNHYIIKTSGKTYTPSATGGTWRASDYIEVSPNTKYSFNEISATASAAGSAWYDENKNYISGFNATELANNGQIMTSPDNAKYLRHSFRIDGNYNSDWQNTIMISESDELVPYENYIEPSITNIYLDEPLCKFENNEDYIDFANQKIVRNVKVENGTYSQLVPPLEQAISLPEVTTIKGTCILSCDTTLVPSNMSATYKSSKNI